MTERKAAATRWRHPGGIQVGDIIVMFDGYEIKEVRDLPPRVADTPIGEDVQVVVIRKARQRP